MRIARLRLRNFSCYRGEHVLELEDKVYAVVARRAGDAESSNWAGKSTLLEAVDFALYGRHRFRTEDEWITRGESSGEVEIEFDDDALRILRSRQRGKRTTLYAFDPHKQWLQEEAQEVIDATLGLSEQDYLMTSRFEQRQMARMVLAKPEERMGIVSAWLKLEPLEKCEGAVREKATALADRIRDIDAMLGADVAEPVNEDVLAGTISLAESYRASVRQFQSSFEYNATLLAAQAKREEYAETVEEGKRLKEQVDALDLDALREDAKAKEEAHVAASSALAAAEKVHAGKLVVERGEFDGMCPVAEIQCPARDKINAGRKAATTARAASQEAVDKTTRARQVALGALRDADVALGEGERLEERLKALRERATRLKGEVRAGPKGEPEDPEVLRLRLQAARERLDDTIRDQAVLEAAKRAQEARTARAEGLAEEREKLAAELAVWREAAVIFGKGGAQRKVAEGALAEIEDGANETLRACGINLNVQVQWSREGKGLATACEACGAPYPASAKVKLCARCGSVRGPHLVNKLEVVLSDRSGAAEDLGGAAIQLAASAWLRNDRGSAWDAALIDEPFGQLDKPLRRAFANHLVSMLGGYGYSQAFVISHSPDVADALPARIEIVSEGGFATLRVIG